VLPSTSQSQTTAVADVTPAAAVGCRSATRRRPPSSRRPAARATADARDRTRGTAVASRISAHAVRTNSSKVPNDPQGPVTTEKPRAVNRERVPALTPKQTASANAPRTRLRVPESPLNRHRKPSTVRASPSQLSPRQKQMILMRPSSSSPLETAAPPACTPRLTPDPCIDLTDRRMISCAEARQRIPRDSFRCTGGQQPELEHPALHGSNVVVSGGRASRRRAGRGWWWSAPSSS